MRLFDHHDVHGCEIGIRMPSPFPFVLNFPVSSGHVPNTETPSMLIDDLMSVYDSLRSHCSRQIVHWLGRTGDTFQGRAGPAQRRSQLFDSFGFRRCDTKVACPTALK